MLLTSSESALGYFPDLPESFILLEYRIFDLQEIR